MSEVAASTPQGALRGFAAYLRRPTLTAPSGLRSDAAWRDLGVLLILQVGVLLAIILPLMIAWQNAFELGGPDAFDQIPEELIVPLSLFIMPVLEELFFRGWLTGRKRALWLLLCAALVVGSGLTIRDENVPPLAMAGVLGGILAAPIGWFILRKKVEPPRWFAAGFPAIFYLSLLGFALLHLSNYSNSSLIAVPLVLPQLWVGTVLGYVRMRIGLPASILAHILSNGAVLLITPLFG
jgi:membrane protease YdiL (CAAX protease family)